MNLCVPDWGMEDDFRSFHDHFPASNEKKSMEPDDKLVELLWMNGHVVMQSQNNRKPPTNVCELKQAQKPDPHLKPAVPPVSPTNLIQDETASWFQYTIDDPLEKAFSPDFLDDMPTAYTVDTNKPNKEVTNGLGGNSFRMPPPISHTGDAQMASTMVDGGPANFSHFSRPVKADMGSSSIRTVGSSACGSNQVQNQTDASYNLSKGVNTRISPKERARANTLDTTGTSSSGGSGCSFGRIMGYQSTANLSHKRKGRDGEESESHSEEAEFESVEADRPTQRPESTRKSRAAEVHNQSERRRRDRINEKMRALQLLIPHCNKSDKASMLDEAIEYLKSLQLQLQLMWMGSGMTPMMFPGVQQYMPQMGHAPVPSINNHIQLPRNPLANHSIPSTPSANQMPMCMSPTVGPVNFPTQMQNVHLPESYARYYGYPHMQLPAQHMNLYTYGSHVMQQNQSAGSSSLPAAGIPSENIQNGPSGN